MNHSHIEYFIPRNMMKYVSFFHEIFHVRIYDLRLGIWVSRKTCGGRQPSPKKDFGTLHWSLQDGGSGGQHGSSGHAMFSTVSVVFEQGILNSSINSMMIYSDFPAHGRWNPFSLRVAASFTSRRPRQNVRSQSKTTATTSVFH